jgi:CheY-like chemotaxis protein
MGGEIRVEAEENGGSTFIVSLRARVDTVQPHLHLEGLDGLRGGRVLIVDDNATQAHVLEGICGGLGMMPKVTTSARVGVELLRSGEKFDLVLVDLLMPEMDGVEFARHVRSIPACERLPHLLLASASSLTSRVDEVSACFAGHLHKPIKRGVLAKMMSSVMGSRVTYQVSQSREKVLDHTLATRIPLRILIAEDNPVNQALALAIFRKMGYRADCVADGQEVLDALAQRPYDLIFMDVQMPVMDGLEATQRIVETMLPDARPRIIAMTANAMCGDRERCLQSGMDDYISKPIRIEELREMVERHGTAAISARSVA